MMTDRLTLVGLSLLAAAACGNVNYADPSIDPPKARISPKSPSVRVNYERLKDSHQLIPGLRVTVEGDPAAYAELLSGLERFGPVRFSDGAIFNQSSTTCSSLFAGLKLAVEGSLVTWSTCVDGEASPVFETTVDEAVTTIVEHLESRGAMLFELAPTARLAILGATGNLEILNLRTGNTEATIEQVTDMLCGSDDILVERASGDSGVLRGDGELAPDRTFAWDRCGAVEVPLDDPRGRRNGRLLPGCRDVVYNQGCELVVESVAQEAVGVRPERSAGEFGTCKYAEIHPEVLLPEHIMKGPIVMWDRGLKPAWGPGHHFGPNLENIHLGRGVYTLVVGDWIGYQPYPMLAIGFAGGAVRKPGARKACFMGAE